MNEMWWRHLSSKSVTNKYLANMSSIEAPEFSSVSGVGRGGSPLIEEVGVLKKNNTF